MDELEKESQRITDENAMLISLTQSTIKLTEEQKQQINKIQQEIDGYESDRAAAIAGAVTTGVVAGIAIVGGILLIALLPGVGVPMGIACIFGGSVSATGTVLCSVKAEELRKKINDLTSNMDEIQKEETALSLIGNQFSKMAKQMNDLKDAVKDIEANWNGVVTIVNNIKEKAKKLKEVDFENADIETWKAIENDLKSIQAIEESLEEAIDSLSTSIKVYSNCKLDGCTTKEEIEKKLKEYAASLDVKNDMVS